MKNQIYIFISGLLMACGGPSEEDPHLRKTDSLETRVDMLRQTNDSLIKIIQNQEQQKIEYPPYFDSISDPEAYITQKLQENPELIPVEPVLGGKMRYTEVEVLNEELILVEYEDGHILGKSIFRYQPDLSGGLHFELVTQL